MVVTVENNNGEQNVGGQRVGENQGSALDQLRKTVVSYSLEEEVIRAELRWVLKMVESDYSFNSAENMVKLLCLMDKHSKIFPKMTLGRQKCGYYVTHALYSFYPEKLIKRFQEAAAYTLGVDGGSVTQHRNHTLRFILSVNISSVYYISIYCSSLRSLSFVYSLLTHYNS